MPRLNGKFVSQAVFDAAQNEAAVEVAEESIVSEDNIETAVTTDRRRGPRPGTALKKALIAKLNAEHKLAMAVAKLSQFDGRRDQLADAVDAAEQSLADTLKAVEDAQENL